MEPTSSSPPRTSSSAPSGPAPDKRSGKVLLRVAIFGGGGLLLLVIVGFWALLNARRFLVDDKVVEARTALKQMAQLSTKAAMRRQGTFCASASSPIPADAAKIRGKKYASKPEEWRVDATKDAGFACLGFEMTTPQAFQYAYTANAEGSAFAIVAHGDLTGDGILSTFRMTGSIVAGQPTYLPTIDETDQIE